MDATGNELVETQYYGCCVVDLYNEHRPHRSLDQQAPTCSVQLQVYAIVDPSQVRRDDQLAGLINEHEIAA